MESMSINPAAAAIGSQLVDVASRGLGSGAMALPSLTALAPAGAEEVSMQAATAFAAEAQAMLALNTAAQEELARAGVALTEIARMYTQVDGEAAGALMADGSRFASQAFAAGAAANAAAAEVAARAPLTANLLEGVAASNPSAPTSVVPAGAAPLSSIGSIASAGGAAGPGSASAVPGLASSLDEEKDDTEAENSGEPQPGERLL